jgi:hypothetical protein
VGRQDVEGVALVESPLVGHDGCCDSLSTIESSSISAEQWTGLTLVTCMICRCRKA